MLVDAENVRRSAWPNLSHEELVRRCRAWAERAGVDLLVVFDGEPPAAAQDLVAAPPSGADDRIVELAGSIDGPVWLVTSDRELRARVGGRAARVVGGGGFLRELAAG